MKSISDSRTTLKQALVCTIMALLLFATAIATAQTYTMLYTYPIGAGAYSGIVAPQVMAQGQDGNLYSTIANNGTKTFGTVYKIDTAGVPTTIYSFCLLTSCTDGGNPFGGVTLGVDGNFYGTTQGGGSHAAGTVFKVTPAGSLTTLWNFANGTDDSVPVYTTSLGQDGNMYGVSVGQYNGEYGAFFKVSAAGLFKALSDFAYTNGALPNLPTQGSDGNFYGTAQLGGDPTCKCGVVYKATAAGKITVLHTFKGYPTDGNHPYGILVQSTDGNFYGTTYRGGAHNGGSVFKITPTGVYTLLYSFNFSSSYLDAQLPVAGLTLGTDDNFYGLGSAGGTKNYGAIFKITSGGTESVIYSFCSKTGCTDGLGPATPLVQHTDGKFYGNTNGNSLGGSVFYSFDMGLSPFSHLVLWEGNVGAKIGVLGQGFTGGASVSFSGGSAAVTVVSDTYLVATVPANAATGNVTVVTSSGTLVSSHKFFVVPTIKTISPTSGPVGSAVVVSGTGFTGVKSVTIGGKAATFKVNSNSQITATVPVGASTGKIVVTTAGGKATSASTFTVT